MSTPPPQKTSRPRWSYPRKPPPRSFATASKIVEYLAKTFPALIDIKKVNVNTAAAKDIETTLELSPETAAAIVRYREQNGAFKTIDDVKKVPGVDAAKIESKKDRLEF